MAKAQKQHIVIIGCGNVAWHLAKRFSELKNTQVYVYNHKENKLLKKFKTQLNCQIFSNLKEIIAGADYYFICVADSFISSVSQKIKPFNKESLVLHTSGSISIDAIKTDTYCKAVFYPLQTFSKNDVIDWQSVPILIEANNNYTFKNTTTLAKKISNTHLKVNYSQRLNIHLAAVLVNNFTNALYVSAAEHLQKQKLNFILLLPLIQQTVTKLKVLSPLQAQTGPAKRNDLVVLKKHKQLLNDNIKLKQLYIQFTELIQTQQK